MKSIFTFLLILSVVFAVNSQCNPDPLCIDTGEPGQICPDTMPDGRVNELYFQTITIWAPASIVFEGNTINLSHLKLQNITNIPAGLTWESNATDDLFQVGTSYCVLIQGTPETAGFYQLEIEVQPYIFSIPMPYTIVDDTSLSIIIQPELGMFDIQNQSFSVSGPYPNPFTGSSELTINSVQSGNMVYKVFNRFGELVLSGEKETFPGSNLIEIQGKDLSGGVYFYSIMLNNQIVTGKIVKI